MYPKLEINISKLKKNLRTVSALIKKNNLSLTMVTKAYCADINIISELVDENVIDYLADSRIQNLKNLKNINIPKILLRIPMLSEVKDVIETVDISFNSEYVVIEKLNIEAEKRGKIHKIVIMVDLGDLREGYFDEKELFEAIEKIIKLKNIKLIGVATNLTCYGAVLPSETNLGKLCSIAQKIEKRYCLKLEIVSGGNSSSLYLLQEGKMPTKINNLRIGEAILLGRETAYSQKLEGTYNDAFKLFCEIIEDKEKESIPIGEIGVDAFGNKPVYIDKGRRQRAILGIGKQDIKIDSITSVNENIEVIGASSDHTILDITVDKERYKVGDIVEFILDYGGIMSAFTSKYIEKSYIN
ncbi:ornithine racemase Orr [Fusobacterium sp.]|uniref:ornithine racemase Orr n=1 Tax=Fusobacterium sp. TaxID=68766 RepID=UPI0025C63462|nr:ornithine racemase Orr [Fusobacterium sp.]